MENYMSWFQKSEFHTCHYLQDWSPQSKFNERYFNEKKITQTHDFYILLCPMFMCIGESSRFEALNRNSTEGILMRKKCRLDFYILLCPILMCIRESSRFLNFTVKFVLYCRNALTCSLRHLKILLLPCYSSQFNVM